jgi:hypothetical protein
MSGVQKSRALNFAPWKLMFAGPRSGTCVMSPFWRLEILRWLLCFLKFVRSALVFYGLVMACQNFRAMAAYAAIALTTSVRRLYLH